MSNRNSTPEGSLRPPTLGAGHRLRSSAELPFPVSSGMASRPLRPASEIFTTPITQQEEIMDKATQQWIADIEQYESTLEEMAAATTDQDFKNELNAIEQWFRVLSEAERTAALFALLKQATQVQVRFFIQVLQQVASSHPVSGVLSPANFGDSGKFVYSSSLSRRLSLTLSDDVLCSQASRRAVCWHGAPTGSLCSWAQPLSTSPIPSTKATR